MTVITLTTDFGSDVGYVAAMKGVILSINGGANIIDISHSILPQNIPHGAFVLFSVAKYFENAIHVGVIDPGVGTERNGLIIECENGVLIGPDNGLLIPAAELLGIESVFKITYPLTETDSVSSTFHGRDIFAPLAGQLSLGKPIAEFGVKCDEYMGLNLFDVSDYDLAIQGKILNIDRFGNIITNIPRSIVEKYFKNGDEVRICQGPPGSDLRFNGKLPFMNTYADVPEGKLLALISSTELLELAANRSNANERLGFKISDTISILKN